MNELPTVSGEETNEISLTFRKGLLVMTAFDGTSRQLTLAEIARKTDLNRAVARRLVRTLVQAGMLVEQDQRFEMTVGVLRLMRGFIDGRRIASTIQPILRRASEAANESLSFALRDQDNAVYIAHAYLPGAFTLNQIAIGTHVPLVKSAAGHAILAWVPENMWPEGAEADRINETRKQGYAFIHEGLVAGVSSMAMPVFGPSGKIEGAISALFPADRYDTVGAPQELIEVMRQTAVDIGANI
jgi:IclR family pca regulon transcriptional regulator